MRNFEYSLSELPCSYGCTLTFWNMTAALWSRSVRKAVKMKKQEMNSSRELCRLTTCLSLPLMLSSRQFSLKLHLEHPSGVVHTRYHTQLLMRHMLTFVQSPMSVLCLDEIPNFSHEISLRKVRRVWNRHISTDVFSSHCLITSCSCMSLSAMTTLILCHSLLHLLNVSIIHLMLYSSSHTRTQTPTISL